ncbi:MAG: class I SAM-dependent methyltransferase [Saprospiraceae bacterium]|jgi:SAM-dependent methyltransferase|nr:class I SAM-dependent methyltransferase [Saprospiraceae bacterium]
MSALSSLLGQTDIYLLDQIMKGRYAPSELILDAGAGAGRNLHWFVQQGFRVFGADRYPAAVEALRRNYPGIPDDNFLVAPVENLPFPDGFFHHVICSAVLHFADNEAHFKQMFGELARVLRPGGSLFLRVATDVGLAHKMIPLGHGRFAMPDGTDRFLLTRPTLEALMRTHKLRYLEPFKTVLVDELRSMTALVLGS